MIKKETYGQAWEGGDKPYKASYGKLMMWFFLITDTLTFSALLRIIFSLIRKNFLTKSLNFCLSLKKFSENDSEKISLISR